MKANYYNINVRGGGCSHTWLSTVLNDMLDLLHRLKTIFMYEPIFRRYSYTNLLEEKLVFQFTSNFHVSPAPPPLARARYYRRYRRRCRSPLRARSTLPAQPHKLRVRNALFSPSCRLLGLGVTPFTGDADFSFSVAVTALCCFSNQPYVCAAGIVALAVLGSGGLYALSVNSLLRSGWPTPPLDFWQVRLSSCCTILCNASRLCYRKYDTNVYHGGPDCCLQAL